jgi:hypothetical protein
MNKIEIKSVSYGVLGNATQIDITILPFNLGLIPKVRVDIVNDEKSFESKTLDMPEDIYENWGTDDSTIINWVYEELGLTLV